eukprot:64601-Rhodomonas_salina.2
MSRAMDEHPDSQELQASPALPFLLAISDARSLTAGVSSLPATGAANLAAPLRLLPDHRELAGREAAPQLAHLARRGP